MSDTTSSITATTTAGMDLVRQALSRYTDKPVADISPATELADIDVDSLTLAELLFELEDRLHVTMAEAEQLPKTVADLLAMITPYLKGGELPAAA